MRLFSTRSPLYRQSVHLFSTAFPLFSTACRQAFRHPLAISAALLRSGYRNFWVILRNPREITQTQRAHWRTPERFDEQTFALYKIICSILEVQRGAVARTDYAFTARQPWPPVSRMASCRPALCSERRAQVGNTQASPPQGRHTGVGAAAPAAAGQRASAGRRAGGGCGGERAARTRQRAGHARRPSDPAAAATTAGAGETRWPHGRTGRPRRISVSRRHCT